ncbi:MAG: EFR1 family ferrodoxin [Candidatus Omnitrophota bacterium]
MKTSIFYFSGTGNCLKVAHDLAAELGDSEVISIPKAIGSQLDLSAGTIGIVYPVYMWGMPLIVARFIEKLKPAGDKYIFAVATYGGICGNALGQTARQFESQGQRLSAGFAVKMPGNYTPLYGAIPEEKQVRIFRKEEERVKEIARIVKDKRPYKIEKNFILINLLSRFIYKLGSPKIPVMDTGFWVDEKCNGCGICEKVCPVDNIKLSSGRPVWQHKCEQCMACLQWCPQEAIQYKKSTLTRKRYRNPQVTLIDLLK